MGVIVGVTVGLKDGQTVGLAEGEIVGHLVGPDGALVGIFVGRCVGV